MAASIAPLQPPAMALPAPTVVVPAAAPQPIPLSAPILAAQTPVTTAGIQLLGLPLVLLQFLLALLLSLVHQHQHQLPRLDNSKSLDALSSSPAIWP